MISRKLLQDLVTPELRALAIEVKALRGETDRRFDETSRRFEEVNKQFAGLRGEMREMRGELRAEVKNGVQYIVSQLQLDQRLGKLEEENQRKKQLPEKQ